MIDSVLVESVIRTNPSVADCAVRVRHTEDGTSLLVAYVHSQGPFAPDALGAWVSSRLPQSLLPAAWVQVARVPLTAEGRPDDDALFALPILSPEVIRRCEELVNS